MRMNADKWKRLLGAVFLCWLVIGLLPAHAIEKGEQSRYVEMSDSQLTEVLKSWSSLDSSDRRGLLVEIKRRMESPQKSQSVTTTSHRHVQGITIRIRMQQTRQFGVKLRAQAGDLRTGGVFVIRGEFSSPGNQSNGMRSLQVHAPSLNGERHPLPGPGFGRGFNERQAFLRAAYPDASPNVVRAFKLKRASSITPASAGEGVD